MYSKEVNDIPSLADKCITQIDNYFLGKSHFVNFQELTNILKKYQLKDSDKISARPNFPYGALLKSVVIYSEKRLTKLSELALEMRLLRAELEYTTTDKEKLKDIRKILSDISTNFRWDKRQKRDTLWLLQ